MFLDIQISCHFVVLLIKHFKNQYLELIVPLHFIGSNFYEVFFPKIGIMLGMECAYDFYELVNCANTFNHVVAIKYGENGVQFGRMHNN
jgi:hypothetical protein